MAKSPPPPTDPVSVVIPIPFPGLYVPAALRAWFAYLDRLSVATEVLVVDDGNPPEFTVELAKVIGECSYARVLRHELPRGFGACLRTALAELKHPLFFYTALDYPYTPADLGKLLARIDQTDELFQRKLDVVSGCRTGRPVPAGWSFVGKCVRTFARVALGLPLEPLPGWLGLREHLWSWLVWVVFGDPLTDPNSEFKLFRKSVFDRFPIQSDSGFVHVELLSKATFITCLMDELPLTPKSDPLPLVVWRDFWKVLTDARFTAPAPTPSPEPMPVEPAAP